MNLWEYYGVDWLAMGLTFLAIWLIGNKNRNGFVIHIVGNLCWISMGFMAGSLATMVANAAFIAVNARAILLWSKPEQSIH